MATFIIRHRVGNFENWQPGFLAHAPVRKENGIAGHRLLRDSADPNMVTVVLEVSDLARAKSFLASPDLHAAMAKAGVQGAPEIHFLEEASAQTY